MGVCRFALDGQACYYVGMKTFTIKDDGLGVSFVWSGGAYIDIMFRGVAVSAWNVWDYADDLPTIARTEKSFARYVAKRLRVADDVADIRQATLETTPHYWSPT